MPQCSGQNCRLATCCLQKSKHPWQQQDGNHSWGWSLSCQHTQDTTLMPGTSLRSGLWKTQTHFGPQQSTPRSRGNEDGCLFAQNHTLLPPGSVLQRIWGDPCPGIPRTLCLYILHKAAGAPVTGAAEHPCDANPCSRAKASRSGWKSAHTPFEQEILLPNSVSMRANVFRSPKGDSKRSFKQLTR